jgi:hypothetical protein
LERLHVKKIVSATTKKNNTKKMKMPAQMSREKNLKTKQTTKKIRKNNNQKKLRNKKRS